MKELRAYRGACALAQDRWLYLNRLDENRLGRAVRLAMDAEPVFGCRYVAGKRSYWERRDDWDSLPLCEVIETTDTQQELGALCRASRRFDQGPAGAGLHRAVHFR